jgi:pimeloyl-ACP methyl ester carboxylesterase
MHQRSTCGSDQLPFSFRELVMAAPTSSPIQTKTRTIDGLSIRYAESAPREVSAILLSPWPESLYTFEQMWSRLAEHAHLVAIDLPGFGHSERRNELLTSSAMGEFIAHLVEEFGLTLPHAVGPDIGTSALLFTTAKHPGLLRSIVIGNGTAAVPLQIGSVLKDVVEAPRLDLFRNLDPRKGVESVLAFVERYRLPEHVREDFLSAYEGDRFVESLRFVRSYPTELPLLGKLLPTIETPVQIITGDHDPGVFQSTATTCASGSRTASLTRSTPATSHGPTPPTNTPP